ncbi:vWA domain-containing protein [Ancylobacter terrae]|uniref:vWA domain-containing protein n=1 Tax=Ancylobacter sp. sgz301288 TaxID=3342077 RepID=UPI00385CFF27
MREGRLADNIAYFARALRAAGLPVGPGAVLDAVRAVETAGVGAREDFYWTLHAVLVTKREQHLIFDQAFAVFWRRRRFLEKMLAMMSPAAPGTPKRERPPVRRIEEAMFAGIGERREEEKPRVEVESRLTVSADEVLRGKDFAQMSAAEIAQARRLIARLRLPDDRVVTRRLVADARGARLDLRATLRAALRSGGVPILLRRRGPGERRPPLVALLDISGSMADYSRPVLHFLHALADSRPGVHTFLFGTRLTNVTRALAHRDPDEALEQVAGTARDWSGGTRIATSLHAFNRDWSRRVLGQGATVLLITDGLEREGDGRLAFEMDRLHRSCRRLVWLNPLLRFDGFAPRAAGMRAMLPHVDDFRPIHNLASMEALVAALGAGSPRGSGTDLARWRRADRARAIG